MGVGSPDKGGESRDGEKHRHRRTACGVGPGWDPASRGAKAALPPPP